MISGDYEKLETQEKIREATAKYGDAWKDPSIPEKQYELAVKVEIDKYRKGAGCAPFDAFVRALLHIPNQLDEEKTTLLDVGASSGYYKEVLEIAGFKYSYTGMDFSPHFKTLAEKLYPGIKFDVGDALNLPYADDSFDIVVSGCCMIHVLDYEKIIAETARVASQYALFHRTPVNLVGPTEFFLKKAYDVPCIEIHFNEQELIGLFSKYGLKLVYLTDVFKVDGFAHYEYLLEKTK